jgi:hypothetical protein
MLFFSLLSSGFDFTNYNVNDIATYSTLQGVGAGCWDAKVSLLGTKSMAKSKGC